MHRCTVGAVNSMLGSTSPRVLSVAGLLPPHGRHPVNDVAPHRTCSRTHATLWTMSLHIAPTHAAMPHAPTARDNTNAHLYTRRIGDARTSHLSGAHTFTRSISHLPSRAHAVTHHPPPPPTSAQHTALCSSKRSHCYQNCVSLYAGRPRLRSPGWADDPHDGREGHRPYTAVVVVMMKQHGRPA